MGCRFRRHPIFAPLGKTKIGTSAKTISSQGRTASLKRFCRDRKDKCKKKTVGRISKVEDAPDCFCLVLNPCHRENP